MASKREIARQLQEIARNAKAATAKADAIKTPPPQSDPRDEEPIVPDHKYGQ